MAGVGLARLGKELKMLTDEPPPGVCAWPVDDCITHLQAQIQGPEDTPYERGTFLLDLQIPDRYPFEPPKVRFVTPIYHPNIDSGGRICLDTLKMRPAGSWAPSMNVPTLLTTIRLLMAHPNGDDGLMPDITEVFLKNPSRFADVARAHVEEHARQGASAASRKVPPERPPAGIGGAQVEGESATKSSARESPRSPSSEKSEARGSFEKEQQGQEKQGPASTAAGSTAEGTPNRKPSGGSPAAPPPSEGSGGGAPGPCAADVDGTASDAKRGEDATAACAKEPQDPPQTSPDESSAKTARGRNSSEEEGGGALDGTSSDDGAWSDSDEDGDNGGRASSAKRARTAP